MSGPLESRDPAAVFDSAYQAAISRWPVPVTSVKVVTGYGATHVLADGAKDAPVVLLPGGGGTATAWRAGARRPDSSPGCAWLSWSSSPGRAGLMTPSGSPATPKTVCRR